MEYNSYYPAQSGHPPPPIPNQQHGCSQIQLMPGANMMHPSIPPQNIPRQVVTPGPPGHQQMQPQPQHQAHHIPPPPQQQQMPPQQHHPNYHQLPPHSGSPHHNPHQPNLNLQPPPRPSTGPSPQHPMHQQSPHHISGPPMHAQQQPQQLNQIGGPPPHLLQPGVNQPQPGMQQHPHHQHNQSFMGAGSIPHQSPHYPQHQPPPPPPPHIHAQPIPPPPPQQQVLPPMHHAPQSLPPTYLPHVHHQPNIERGSPFYQHIPQTEFRIIELNKRLQNRPKTRAPKSPLPLIGSSEESDWWEKFACDFFDDDSTLTLRTAPDDNQYTIGRTLIPRFFKSYFDGGVVDLSIKLRNTRETAHPNMITLECDQADITTKNIFKHLPTNINMNVVVHTEGHLILEFVNSNFDTLLIKSWKFYTSQCHEYIDRSMTTTGLPQASLVEPVTRYGLTNSTVVYLKMCMIMEPMQDLMFHHKQTNKDPRSCLKQLLCDKYKLKTFEDNRAQPNRRRKRKTPAATGTNKKTKANANNANAMNNNNNNNNINNMGFNNINNSLMSPSSVGGVPNISLASQDVMVVGEPSMLGADFGDENERRITRLENNQFDASASSNNITQNQMCNNTSNNQNPNQSNSINNHMQQQNNHDTGNIQMMNHTSSSSNNNNSNSNNNINNGTGDPNNTNNSNGNNCLQNNNNNNNNNNNHQMNLITMNGNVNHINHIAKSEIDLKQSTAPTPTMTDSEAR